MTSELWQGVMDWNMIGALGEILGAAGVVITLGYLARQIRQSNIESRRTAVREAMDLHSRFLDQVGGSLQVADVFRRGLEDDPNLTQGELAQVRALFMQLVNTWQRTWELGGELGMSDAEANSRKEIVVAPGFQKWLTHRGHWIREDFRAQLDRDIASRSEYRFMPKSSEGSP